MSKKVVIVTGSTGMLGEHVVKKFLNEGHSVSALFSSKKESVDAYNKKFAQFENVFPFAVDITNAQSVKNVVTAIAEQFGKIEIVCNIAGGYSPKKTIENVIVEEWDNLFALNLRSVFLMIKYSLPIMKQNNWGRIINIAAKPGIVHEQGRGAYGISKSGVVFLTEIVAEELRAEYDKRITINTIVPGVITVKNDSKTIQPENDTVTAEEIAEKIYSLCTENENITNGKIITMYGSNV